MQSAAELHRRGVTAINRGRARQARSLLVRARERADSEDLLSRIDASMAYVAAETGDPAEAIRLCELARSREGIAPETRGIVESQLAGLRMRRGETAAALASFEIAIGSLDDATELARAHVNRGGVYLQQGLAAPAADDFAAAVAHFSAAGRDVDAAMAEHNLGYAHLLRGDLAAAYQRMEAARLVLQDVSPIVRAIGDQDRAEVLLAAGLVSEGVEALGSAAREFGRRRLQQRRAEAELALARAVLLADPERSLAAARSARRRFARAGQEAWRARAEALAVAAEVETGRRGPSLVRRSDEVAAQLEEQGLSTNATLARLRSALVQVRRGDLDDAAERLSRERVGRSAPLTVQLLASTVRVELARSQGRPGVALRQARQGLDRLHAWQSTLGSLDVQTSVVGRGERLAVHALEIATESARPEVVLEWSERGRMLASRVRPVRPPSDPALAEQLAELRRLQSGRTT
ncbi:hypothetical protein [Nocardioides sp.]|uniref:hypothetical protein n=1 Tax=Nocardioides sp. TaxID=35761 RepID=UPI003529CA7E